jgi:hypothetical protein
MFAPLGVDPRVDVLDDRAVLENLDGANLALRSLELPLARN